MRRESFGTISAVAENGRPHATAVIYAVPTAWRAADPLCHGVRVPVSRLLLPGFPPQAVQFQGTATVVPSEHDGVLRAFDSSWFLRRILVAAQHIVAEGGDVCFIRIHPDSTVFTCRIGMSVWDNMRRRRKSRRAKRRGNVC